MARQSKNRTGFEGSPENPSNRPGAREPAPDDDRGGDKTQGPETGQAEDGPRPRPRNDGNDDNDGNDGPDPTDEKGFVETVEDGLRAADEAIQRAIAPGEPLPFDDPDNPRRRPGRRPPKDSEEVGLRPISRPRVEEEDPIVPGNPDDLGARGRRRRKEDDDTPSPVLRRGLLGV